MLGTELKEQLKEDKAVPLKVWGYDLVDLLESSTIEVIKRRYY